jgi:hypothetical protein
MKILFFLALSMIGILGVLFLGIRPLSVSITSMFGILDVMLILTISLGFVFFGLVGINTVVNIGA